MGYLNVPAGQRPNTGQLPDAPRRAPISPPHVDSGASRNYARSGPAEIDLGGKFKGFERSFTQRVNNRLVRKALGNGETDPMNHWAEHAGPGISNIRPSAKRDQGRVLMQNNPHTPVKGAIGPGSRPHGGPSSSSFGTPGVGPGPQPAGALPAGPHAFPQGPVPRAQSQYPSGPPGELGATTGHGAPRYEGNVEKGFSNSQGIGSSMQFSGVNDSLRGAPIHKMGAIDTTSTSRPRPAARQASFDAKRRAAWNANPNNPPPTPQM